MVSELLDKIFVTQIHLCNQCLVMKSGNANTQKPWTFFPISTMIIKDGYDN